MAEVLTLPQAALPPSLNPHPAGNVALNLCKMVVARMCVGWPGREEGFDMIARRADAGLTNKSWRLNPDDIRGWPSALGLDRRDILPDILMDHIPGKKTAAVSSRLPPSVWKSEVSVAAINVEAERTAGVVLMRYGV